MSSAFLRLNLMFAYEGEAVVSASCASGLFQGHAGAGADVSRIERFVEQLRRFPIPHQNPAILQAGDFKSGELARTGEFLEIIVGPRGSLGDLLVEASIGGSVLGRPEQQISQSVTVRFLTDYASAAEFAAVLDAFAKTDFARWEGNSFKATLKAK
jgi:hypothetical protein